MLAVCREEAAATTKGADGTGKTLKAMRYRVKTVLVLMTVAEDTELGSKVVEEVDEKVVAEVVEEVDEKVVAEVDEKEGLLRSVVVASARARWRATRTWS
ncbi:hypothetical protein PRNP1_003063 [Phytophthora ramorum]